MCIFLISILLLPIGHTIGQLVLPTATGTGISSTGVRTTATGLSYTCVLPGTCPSSTTNSTNTIDPRIVVPDQSSQLCPSGFIPCFTINTGCGTRSITPSNTNNGYADAGAYPWQAYLRNTTHSFAGSGVLIDSYHVITAAHKVVQNVVTPSAITVLMGVWNPSLTINTVSSTVAKIEVHPFFNPLTLKNDIAVLRLVTPMTRSAYINTACMPLSGSTSATFVGQRCVVSGWGQTSFFINNAPTNLMKQVFVNVVDYTTCRTSFSAANLLSTNVDTYLDGNGEICAGGESQKDACSVRPIVYPQDGGSPLVCQDTSGVYRVAGLVIWGKNCGQPGVYGVYVSIPAYYNWIETKIQTLNAEFG